MCSNVFQKDGHLQPQLPLGQQHIYIEILSVRDHICKSTYGSWNILQTNFDPTYFKFEKWINLGF